MYIIHNSKKQIQKQEYLNKIKNEKSFFKIAFLYFKMKIDMNIDNYDRKNYLSDNINKKSKNSQLNP